MPEEGNPTQGLFWGTNSVGGGLKPFARVSNTEIRRKAFPVSDASSFGPRKSKANDYVPARFRLQGDGQIDSLMTIPVAAHSLAALG